MHGITPCALSKSAPPIERIDVIEQLDQAISLVGNRSFGRFVTDFDRQPTIDSLSRIREAARRISTVWPEARAKCSQAIALIDRALDRLSVQPEETDVFTVAAITRKAVRT